MKDCLTFAAIGLAILCGCANKSASQDSTQIESARSEETSVVPQSKSAEQGITKKLADEPPSESTPKPKQPSPEPAPAVWKTYSWPNWMGPNHDGVSLETGWSTDWPVAGLQKKWTREIGIGFSSIAIADDRLITMGHIEGEEVVWCLDVKTSNEIWSHRYPGSLNANLHEGGPGSTPTIDGDLVYTLGKDGQLFCLKLSDGSVVWQKQLQDDLKVPLPEWGFASSAYILGDQLLLEAGRVVSYDKKSGEKNWQTETHAAGYGSVMPFKRGDQTLLATLDCEVLRITNSANGMHVADYEWPSPFGTNSTTPIVHDGRIFISSGYHVGCGLFELTAKSPTADGDSADELKPLYTNRGMRNHFNNSILWDGHLYGFDGNSNLGRVVTLTCMEFKSGEVKWKHRGLGCGSLMIADGKLVILSEKGKLVIAEASPKEFKELAQSPFLTGRCWTVPVLVGGHVYGRNARGTLVSVALPQSDQ